MPNIADWRNAIADWWQRTTMPYGSFQTRITRTPGQFVDNLPAGTGANYDKGFIKANPTVNNLNETLRHESVHALFDKANLAPHADQIAPFVNEFTRNKLFASPVYNDEMKRDGIQPILANEGAAFDISRGTAQDKLVNNISNLLQNNPQALSQFNRLVQGGIANPNTEEKKLVDMMKALDGLGVKVRAEGY